MQLGEMRTRSVKNEEKKKSMNQNIDHYLDKETL